MAKLHKGKYCGKKNWVNKTIGYPQSQTNRTIAIPVPGESPEIIDGNWWIGGIDTGVSAQSEQMYEETEW